LLGSKAFLRIYFALGGVSLSLSGILFLQLHELADEQSMAWKQCCQGAEISAAKHIDLDESILCGTEFFRQLQKGLVDLVESFQK
jgi:hypothetical protein